MTDTIELDRELLAEYFHNQYQWIESFYPWDDWADELDYDTAMFNTKDEAREYARGNLIAIDDALCTFGDWFDVDPREMAEDWADAHNKDTFDNLPK